MKTDDRKMECACGMRKGMFSTEESARAVDLEGGESNRDRSRNTFKRHDALPCGSRRCRGSGSGFGLACLLVALSRCVPSFAARKGAKPGRHSLPLVWQRVKALFLARDCRRRPLAASAADSLCTRS
jgi:hypothetical protein